jgi:hypothetical protein
LALEPQRDDEPFASPHASCKDGIVPESTLTPEPALTIEPAVPAATDIPQSPSVPPRQRVLAGYWVTVFLSAFLLFQVQLIVGKYILPLFGGTPAVWNTCMLCFQFLLLLGYAYAHLLGRTSNARKQGKIHGALLIFSAVIVVILWVKWGSPLTPGTAWRPAPEDNPVLKILQLLFATVALPFFVLSTTGPLLQSWYSRDKTSASPYKLYALSNAGSLLGLLSYPFLIEWMFTIKHQAWVWASGYLIFAAICATIGWRFSPNGEDKSPSSPENIAADISPGLRRYLLWIGLSACSTTMLLATTNLICQDLAVIPLLWVVPLCIYLLSFIFSFNSHRWYKRSIFWPFYFVALGVEMKINLFGFHLQTPSQIVMLCAALFVVCMVCHGELASSKPATRHLTSFYLMVAGGGVLGGIFVVMMAPQLFLGFWELQVGLVGCGLLLFAAFLLGDPGGKANAQLWVAVLLIETTFLITNLPNFIPKLEKFPLLARPEFVGLFAGAAFVIYWLLRRKTGSGGGVPALAKFPWQPVAGVLLTAVFGILVYGYVQVRATQILYRERNFYGIKSVINEPETVALLSGSTLHGRQFKNPAVRNTPLSYYRTESGIGLLLNNYPRGNPGNLRVGVIGMGAGTLAAYGRRGDYYRFYEIDPATVELSAGPSPYFYFAHDSVAKIDAVLGDARLSLEKEAGLGERQQFDVLAVDAFSSDAIPVHLLTSQAIDLYLTHMRNAQGVLAFHVTNWHLDLAPVLAALADSHHLAARQVRNLGSTWILLSADPEMLRLPGLAEKSTALVLTRKPVLWTDGYSNLFQVLR